MPLAVSATTVSGLIPAAFDERQDVVGVGVEEVALLDVAPRRGRRVLVVLGERADIG